MSLSLLQNLIAFLSATVGAVVAFAIGVSHKQLCALISFAAGTLFATTFFHIIPEAFHALPIFAIVLALVSGYLLFYLISRYLFHVCPACAASHFDEQTASAFKSIALLLGIALGIHCVMDGIAIALGGELEEKVDRSIFLTITIHKFPEGLALCALLLKAAMGKVKALLVTMAFESSTFLGWILGLFWLKGFQEGGWFYLMLVHVGGGFIYLAFHAVLNESKEHPSRYIIFFFLIGAGLIGLTSFLPD
ncbi:MAG: ZIP family metal transporter [Candidatus Omnitrophica bacterium]|nr:ZIP family metal transporter [Candidatus Omnitrophota bacterium]